VVVRPVRIGPCDRRSLVASISIILPTIDGREESCEFVQRCFLERSADHHVELIVRKNFPNWPAGVNAGMADATGDYLFFAADDLEPLDGWADAMIGCLDAGEIPAPQVWDHRVQGRPVNEPEDGPPGSIPVFSRAPALTRDMAGRIGAWPEIDYYGDNWVCDKARLLGIQIRVTEGFAFVHHWHPVGRLDAGDWVGRNLPAYQAEVAKLHQGGGVTDA